MKYYAQITYEVFALNRRYTMVTLNSCISIFFQHPLSFCNFKTYLQSNVFLAPSDYCNAQLNTSDCAMRPIPVFTYYKPGSRCEIELWRGCTTLNKFEDEYECAHFCIGKLSPSFSAEVDNQILSAETNKTGKIQSF